MGTISFSIHAFGNCLGYYSTGCHGNIGISIAPTIIIIPLFCFKTSPFFRYRVTSLENEMILCAYADINKT